MAGRPIPEKSWIEIVPPTGAPQRIGVELGASPFSFSKAGEATGAVIFAGFGITAADQAYDDYAGLDVKGKVVLVLRHGPAEKDTASPWHNPMGRIRELAFSAKAKRAADAGAAAILLVNDTNHNDEPLPVDAGGEPSPIPVFAIRRATADLLLAAAGKSLATAQAAIDADRKPHSFAVPDLTARVHAEIAGTSGRNVVFVRRGSDETLRDEAVLVCAHMDHVGRGFFGSVSKSTGQIHNGADDNASGTAALLEVAEAMAAGPATKRTLIFAAWCGEEKGLLGSDWFADHPLWDLSKVAVCINLDMVGRYRDAEPKDSGLFACGMPTALGTDEPVARLAAAYKLKLTPSWDAWEQSDHFSFYKKGVPSLFLHTGLHLDYHRPSDDWWKVAAEPEARIAQLVVDLTREIADAAVRPQFAKKPPRPVLGVRLADAEDGAGAKLLEVYPGLGANVAGLRVGDVVTTFGGTKIASAADLSACIQKSKEGDVVDVEFVRGSEKQSVKVRVSGR
jgi:Peptidase family M28/PA domain/PDZ domain